ncbi:hypothetical protein AC579_1865 [Pseudocercospora musae]|uniref:Pyridoxamine 5'-phosphate oxidase Alr4036 family FMN-binding domain-containing protein n=1 Tax=Pseudocercospora musae TaxID=113226 RepID=A0A139IBW5_9PEZI|nr:hypothetical protein AC579_1865 [Pseudocercospora musae]
MDHELNITLTLGPFHFKISHKNHITPSLHDGTRNHHHHHHTKLHRKTSSLQTAATIASHASYAASRVSSRLSQHLRTLSLQSSRAMATTSSTNMPIEAPWKKQFQEHLSKMESPEFVFSSLHPAEKGSPVPYVPRARYCIHRAFWAELPENKHNTAPMNARNYASDMPTFTTDVRMSKTFEIFNTSPGHADRDSLIQGSGGGGPCEAVYWVKESMVQWRFKGDAFVIAPDIEGEGEESSGVRTVKSELGKRMRILKEDGIEEWSWKRELTGHFGNISPGMRGEFLRNIFPCGCLYLRGWAICWITKACRTVTSTTSLVAKDAFAAIFSKLRMSVQGRNASAQKRHTPLWLGSNAYHHRRPVCTPRPGCTGRPASHG